MVEEEGQEGEGREGEGQEGRSWAREAAHTWVRAATGHRGEGLYMTHVGWPRDMIHMVILITKVTLGGPAHPLLHRPRDIVM